MDYSTALHHLLSLVDLERTAGPPHRKYKLERMRALAQRLGNPHDVTPTVHITGTKGKGSTAAMVTSVLEQAGALPACTPRRTCTRFGSASGWGKSRSRRRSSGTSWARSGL